MLRLGLGTPVRTLAEVADILGTSPEVARGLEQSALDKLSARS
jgi:DNA-directed RNA polymerase sigma subunit (sigma70/sigma32)